MAMIAAGWEVPLFHPIPRGISEVTVGGSPFSSVVVIIVMWQMTGGFAADMTIAITGVVVSHTFAICTVSKEGLFVYSRRSLFSLSIYIACKKIMRNKIVIIKYTRYKLHVWFSF